MTAPLRTQGEQHSDQLQDEANTLRSLLREQTIEVKRLREKYEPTHEQSLAREVLSPEP